MEIFLASDPMQTDPFTYALKSLKTLPQLPKAHSPLHQTLKLSHTQKKLRLLNLKLFDNS